MSAGCVYRCRALPGLLSLLILLIASAPSLAHAAPSRQELVEPEVSARAAILVEYPSGRILYARNEHLQIPPASTTKILTAIMALEYGDLDEVITVAAEDLVGESSMGLQVGEQQTLRDLLYGLMLPSGNDAAMTIARGLGSKVLTTDASLVDPAARFMQMMNVRVEQLGLENSHFVNPHGLDEPGHYSTAYDLASLSWYALHIPEFNEIVRQVSHQAPGHFLLNTNEMLTRYEGADGIKTGWTDECGLCLVTSATRGDHRLISVVLNAPRWWSDSAALLDYGFAKLAAVPTDDSAEVLSVGKRGTVSWLLVNKGSEEPMPAVAPPGQGGGLVVPLAPEEKQEVAVSASAPPSSMSDRQVVEGLTLLSGEQDRIGGLWAMGVMALVGAGIFYLLSRRFWGLRPATAPASAEASGPPIRSAPASWVKTPADVAEPAPVARTLGEPQLTRRREPNLLLTPDELRAVHVERALQLAEQGRQGSSMSEFIQALRYDPSLDAASLAEQYQMSPIAFLALSRAHLATGNVSEARRTLVHAVLVMPEDRMLRLALSQLRSDIA